ncbi:MAG: hypothetical protein CSH37_11275 [Thalassolituus sp.]|jgi:DNA-binding CsgD family transcriptional regulator|nr:MAG: hypothetical protein CSH37_11275 [Thalassolituus sp.]|tara:strand:+ start:2254 stop:3387 length:1134 start_codon:yes stop_codon:yes gene_type:complete
MTEIAAQDVSLLDYFLDANCHPAGWQDLLDKLLEHFTLRHVNFYMLDSKFNLLFQEWSGIQPSVEAIDEYLTKYLPTDKVHQTMLMSPERKWITGNFEPYRSMLLETPGYEGWAVRHNMPYTTGCVLHRSKQGQVQLLFQRGEEHGPFTQDEEDRFTAMSGLMAKAVALRLKLASQPQNDLRLKSVLNKLRLPVSAVNEFGEVVAHNNAMLKFLQGQSELVIDNHQIKFSDDKSNSSIKHLITQKVSRGKGIASPFDSHPETVKISGKSSNFFVGVCELYEISEDDENFSGALMYVVSPDILAPVNKDQLKNIFSLTESEAYVCSLFVQNKSLKDIALIKKKSVNTVREQLQNSYVKTNTKNQLELMNLLASLPVTG